MRLGSKAEAIFSHRVKINGGMGEMFQSIFLAWPHISIAAKRRLINCIPYIPS